MSYQKRTLRRMKTEQRRLAEIYNVIEGGMRQLKRMIDTVGDLELDSRALENMGRIHADVAPKPNAMILWPSCPRCAGDTVILPSGLIACERCEWAPTEKEVVDQIKIAQKTNPLLEATRTAVLMLEMGSGSTSVFEVLKDALHKEGII